MRAARLRDVDLGETPGRLPPEGEPGDARGGEAVDLPARVGGAGRIGADDVEVHPLAPGLHVELDAGGEAAGERAQRRQGARQLGAEQQAGLDVHELVRAAGAEAEEAARTDGQPRPIAVAVGWAGGDDRRDRDAAERPLDGRPLPLVLRR